MYLRSFNMRLLWIFILLQIIFLAGCNSDGSLGISNTPTPAPTLTPIPTPTPTPTPYQLELRKLTINETVPCRSLMNPGEEDTDYYPSENGEYVDMYNDQEVKYVIIETLKYGFSSKPNIVTHDYTNLYQPTDNEVQYISTESSLTERDGYYYGYYIADVEGRSFFLEIDSETAYRFMCVNDTLAIRYFEDLSLFNVLNLLFAADAGGVIKWLKNRQ